jgi:hypothetical protein
MKEKNLDSTASSEQSQPCCGSGSPCGTDGGCSRRCCRLARILLVLLIVLGVVGYWWLFGRIRSLAVYRAAMQTIQADKRLQEELGQPIQSISWPPRSAAPSARIGDSEIDVRWGIEGPKGRAKAHVQAERRSGQWQTVVLEVVLAGGKRIALHAGDASDDAPAFKPSKPQDKKPETPPPEINLPTPPVDVPGGS